MIWFTADQHYAHSNIVKYCDRPFVDVQEMNYELIRRHNEIVKPSDTIYMIGDVTLNGIETFEDYMNQLNGLIYVLPGSHDHRWLKDFDSKLGLRNVQLLPALYSLELDNRLVVVLCHYALRVWDRSHYGAISLYGHSHGKLPPEGRQMDVGVDCHNFYPVSLDYVLQMLNNND